VSLSVWSSPFRSLKSKGHTAKPCIEAFSFLSEETGTPIDERRGHNIITRNPIFLISEDNIKTRF
jgi:hypothetical protein